MADAYTPTREDKFSFGFVDSGKSRTRSPLATQRAKRLRPSGLCNA